MTQNNNYKEARHSLNYAAPIVLSLNLIAALAIFIASDFIFLEEKTFLGGLLAGAFVLTGVILFVILKAMGSRVTRTEIKNPERHEN